MAINGSHAASSNYITTAASPFLQPGRTITVMCWANPNVATPNGNYYMVLGTATVAASSGWAVSLRGISGGAVWDASFTANGTNYDDYRFTTQAAVGRWDHVAWVLRADATEAGYLNGTVEALLSFANAGAVAPETSRGLQILNGDVTGNGSFGGSVAYVRIFDGELGAGEITAEMASKKARNQRLPVLFDMPDPYAGVDHGPLGLHVASVTGTVTWAPDPPLPEPQPSQLSRFRTLGTAGGGPTPISVGDTGSATETLTATVAAPLADSGAGADTVTVAATAALTDAGSAAQTLTATATVPLGDVGAASQALTVTASAPLADVGTGSDALTATGATPLADNGAAGDALTSAAAVGLADAGSSTQTLTVNATSGLADTGTASQALTVTATVALADSGTAADALLAGIGIFPTDAGSAAEALAVTAAATLADTAAAADTLTAAAAAGITDAGAAGDTLTAIVTTALGDTAAAVDALTRTVLVLLTDSGTATDVLTIDGGPAAPVTPAAYTRSHVTGSRSRPGVARPYAHPTGG